MGHDSEHAGSLRLAFSYDEAGVALLRSRARRRKPAPPTDPLDVPPPDNAVVLELRTGRGDVRYRRLLPEPFPQSVEVADDDGRLRRVHYTRRSGAFSVVVPIPAEPWTVVLTVGPDVELGQPALAAPPGARPRRRELARFDLEPVD